jgi:hypothetical protein
MSWLINLREKFRGVGRSSRDQFFRIPLTKIEIGKWGYGVRGVK